MSQNYKTVVSSETLATLTSDHIPNSLAALRSSFSGSSAPSDTIAGMFWFDTSNKVLKLRNDANNAWIEVQAFTVPILTGAVSGTLTRYLPLHAACRIDSLVVLSDTATTSSDGSNNWTFDLYNITQANSLFSTVPTTNGGELAVDTRSTYSADQNQTIAAADVVEFRATRNGTGTDLSSASVLVYAVATVRVA